MKIELTAIEARIIGCLLEKEVTTPDQYPLTLNSLISACNQKSSREPVMSLSEEEVVSALDSLIAKHLVSDESSFNSRVAKYQHRFCNTEFGDLQFSQQEKAIVCLLLLRGAQTAGELRTRTNRLCQFADVKEAELLLDKLSSGQTESDETAVPWLVKLPKEPGKRESRYMHQFSGLVEISEVVTISSSHNVSKTPSYPAYEEKLSHLEDEISDLKREIENLRNLIGH